MKNKGRWIALATALVLTALCGGAALAASGDKDDPLVTLSYLEQTVLPDVVNQVEEKLDARQEELSRLIGGAQVSDALRRSAAELLERARAYREARKTEA